MLISHERDLKKTKTIRTTKEIIISAGAINSPQILKLSGIGPRHELINQEIEIIHDSPLVGRNLFDHINAPLFVSIKEPESATRNKIVSISEWYKYFRYGKGVLSNPAVAGFATSTIKHHGVALFGMGSVDESALRAIANYKPNIFRTLFPLYLNASQEGFILLNTCYKPMSRGSIQLKSNHISTPPLINPNYLSQRQDVKCIQNAIRLSVKLLQTNAFRKIGVRIHWPKLKACSKFGPTSNDYLTNNPSDEYLECVIRYGGLTAHHPGGTCAMGNYNTNVLDQYLRCQKNSINLKFLFYYLIFITGFEE